MSHINDIDNIPLVDSIKELSNYINKYVYIHIREDIYQENSSNVWYKDNVWYKRYLNQTIKVKVLFVDPKNTCARVEVKLGDSIFSVYIDTHTLVKNSKLKKCINIIINELI
jgi:hypothetical protein